MVLLADGFEKALIGYGRQFNKELAVYDRAKCMREQSSLRGNVVNDLMACSLTWMPPPKGASGRQESLHGRSREEANGRIPPGH